MRLYQIPTEFQLADILTKALQLGPFEKCLYGLLGEDPPRRADYPRGGLRDLGLRRGRDRSGRDLEIRVTSALRRGDW